MQHAQRRCRIAPIEHAAGPAAWRSGLHAAPRYAGACARAPHTAPCASRSSSSNSSGSTSGSSSSTSTPHPSAAAAAAAAAAAPPNREAAAAPAPATTRRRLLASSAAAAGAIAWLPPLLRPAPARAEAAILVGPPEMGGRFQTIGEAIEAAAPGSTVTILPGRYEERLIVDGKFLTIQSAQARSVEVVWRSERPYEHTLEAKNTGGAVVVRGLMLRHSSKSVAQNYCVLVQGGSSLVLEACDISSDSGVGVGVEGATLQLLDSTVHDCERHGVAAYGGFDGEAHGTPGKCLVSGCTIAGNRLSGVFVRDGGSAVLRDNSVTDNGQYGVSLMDGCTARLFDNKVKGNGAGSVQVDVGSVAVDVQEVASRNSLDAPPVSVTV